MATRDLAKLVVRLEAQTAKYHAELDKANSKLSKFEAQTKRALSGIDTAFKRVLTGAAVVQLARSITNLGDQYIQLQNSLKVTGLEGASLEAVQSRLFATAKKNGVGVSELAQLYQRASLSSKELGASQEQLLRFVDGVSTALRVAGTSTQAASGALLQLGQALGNPLIQAQEFNSILDGAQPVLQAVANGIDKYGGSISKLRAGVLSQKVTNQEFFDGFLRGAKGLEQQAAKTTLTVGQSFTNLQTSLVEVIGKFAATSGVSTGVASAIDLLAKNIENLARALLVAATAATVFAASLAIDRIVKTTKAFIDLFTAVASGRAILLGSAAATQAKAIATAAAAEADAARAAAVVASTRAELAEVEALIAATAATSANTGAILVNARGQAVLAGSVEAANVALARRQLLAGQLASVEAQAATAQLAAAQAQKAAAASTTASAGALTLFRGALVRVLGPFRALGALAVAHPVAATVAGVAAAIAALVIFSDKIKTSADGIITLRDTAIAAWQLITEELAPVINAIREGFAAAIDWITAFFEKISELVAPVGEVLKEAFLLTPLAQTIGFLSEKVSGLFAKVQERARQIAEARRKAGAPPPSSGGPGNPPAPAGDEKALKTIQDLEKSLRQQILTSEQGAVATIRYRIAQGDLADEFKKAGAAADPYRRSLVALTSQQEALKIKQVAKDLHEQIGAFNLTGAALLRYRFEVGDLSKTYADAGEEGRKFAEEAVAAAEAFERIQLDKTLKNINAEILELRGNTAEAFRIRLEVENASQRSQFASLGDNAGLEQLAELERLQVAQAEFNALETEAGRIRDELDRKEARIRNSKEVHAISEITALERIGDAREVAVAQLDTILRKQQQIAEESGNPKLVDNVRQAAVELESLAHQMNLVGEAIQASFEEAAVGPLADFLTGLQSAEDALQSFFAAIQREIANFVARDLLNRMFGNLFTGLTSGGGGGSGWFGQLAGGIAGIFGGAAASAAGASTVPVNFSGPRAMGGSVTAGDAYLVGERGREMFVPEQNGVVVPNHDLRGLMRDQRPLQVVNHFMLQAPQGTVSRQTQSQIAAATARGAADAARRNN